jgi:DNA-binding NarL/FixJ family response regulator
MFRVVLIDPREERRTLTMRLVDHSPGLTVVGVAGNIGDAAMQIRAEHADAALVEIQMPVTLGLEAITTLRHEFPDLRIVVSSFHNDNATREAARECGADGYLAKPLQVRDLLALVVADRAVADADHLGDL